MSQPVKVVVAPKTQGRVSTLDRKLELGGPVGCPAPTDILGEGLCGHADLHLLGLDLHPDSVLVGWADRSTGPHCWETPTSLGSAEAA